jgi:hypothetical protein
MMHLNSGNFFTHFLSGCGFGGDLLDILTAIRYDSPRRDFPHFESTRKDFPYSILRFLCRQDKVE